MEKYIIMDYEKHYKTNLTVTFIIADRRIPYSMKLMIQEINAN